MFEVNDFPGWRLVAPSPLRKILKNQKKMNNRTTMAVAGNQIVLGLCCP
jgi:hypothetical protein